MTDAYREIKRLISYIRSCREANIDCTVTIDKRLTHCVLNALKEIEKYRKIGTVEECQEAVDRQKPKKPVKDKYHHNCCSNCGWIVSGEGGYGEEFCPHCENCGQAIQWDENFEGMDDE